MENNRLTCKDNTVNWTANKLYIYEKNENNTDCNPNLPQGSMNFDNIFYYKVRRV